MYFYIKAILVIALTTSYGLVFSSEKNQCLSGEKTVVIDPSAKPLESLIETYLNDPSYSKLRLVLRAGKYSTQSGLSLSGSPCLRELEIVGAENEEVIISGSNQVKCEAIELNTGLGSVGNELMRCPIVRGVRDRSSYYYRAPLKVIPEKFNIVDNGRMQFPRVIGDDVFKAPRKIYKSDGGINIDIDDANEAIDANPDDYLVFHGFFGNEWRDELIGGIKIARGQYRLVREPHYGLKEYPRVRVEAWPKIYVDSRGGFYRQKRNSSSAVNMVLAQTIFMLSDFHKVIIRNLTLRDSLATTLIAKNIDVFSMTDVNIKNSALNGLELNVSTGRIERIKVSETFGASVVVVAGDRKKLIPSKFVVANSEFSDFGRLYKTGYPGVRIDGVGIAVEDNLIKNGPHSAIVFQGNDHQILRNRIENVVAESGDAGAIYSGRDWTAQGTLISENSISGVLGISPYFGTGIYLDDQASGIAVKNNSFNKVYRAILIGGGRSNLIIENNAKNCSIGLWADARGVFWQKNKTLDSNWDLQKRLLDVPYQSNVYEKYKNLSNLLNDEIGAPKYNKIVSNNLECEQSYKLGPMAEKYYSIQ